jgi:hypothetical protein
MLDDPSRKTQGDGSCEADAAWNASYYRAIRTKIAQELRAEYDLPKNFPHQILTLLMQLNASRGEERPASASDGQS